jgi:hypothetical protein
MSDFAEKYGFMELGERTRDPILEAAIAVSAAQVLGPKPTVKRLMLVRIPEHRFIHGAAMLQGRMANIFYFEDLGVGLIAIVMSARGDNRFIRFTASTSPGGGLDRH